MFIFNRKAPRNIFRIERRDLNGLLSVWPVYFYLISHGLPLPFDRRRKFVRIWFDQLVKNSSVRFGPFKSRVSRRCYFDRTNNALAMKMWFLVLLTSDISVPIIDLLFKIFSSKFIILKNNDTEKNIPTKRFVCQIKNLTWAESSLFRIILKIEGNICWSK